MRLTAERRDGVDWRRRVSVLATATLLTLAVLLVSAGAASARIYDPDAEPCWAFYLTGPVAGNDSALDVAMTKTATWVAGKVWAGANEFDASLARIPAGSSAQPVVHTWNSPASHEDVNTVVAARGSYVYTAGKTLNSAGNYDLILIRWSSLTGAFKWAKRYAGAAKMDDEATDAVIDGNGNAIVCGTGRNAGGSDYWVVRKYSPAGDLKWTWTYDGSAAKNDWPLEMVVDSKNNIYVTGETYQDPVRGAFTVKLSPTGAKLWSRKYRGPDGLGGSGKAIARRPAGGVYVAGYTITEAGGYDGYLLHYTAAGDRKVYELYDANTVAATTQMIRDIAVASNGQVVGVGEHLNLDPLWVLWDTDGSIGDADHDSTAGLDWWEGVATDAYGGIYMTGPYDNPSVNPNIRTLRMSVLPQGGEWLFDYDENGYDREVIAIAASGLSVAVVGRQYNGTNYDQYVHIWTY